MKMEAVQCETYTGLSAYGYLRLLARTVLASFTATLLIVFFLFEERIVINLTMFLDPEVQFLILYVFAIMGLSNFLAMMAISLD